MIRRFSALAITSAVACESPTGPPELDPMDGRWLTPDWRYRVGWRTPAGRAYIRHPILEGVQSEPMDSTP
jgi:hypothetical protein